MKEHIEKQESTDADLQTQIDTNLKTLGNHREILGKINTEIKNIRTYLEN